MDAPTSDQAGGRGLSDNELLARWLDDSDDAGSASLAVFIRYREAVRVELERLGLSPLDAVQQVGTVFHMAQEDRADLAPLPLRERLIAVAREVTELAKPKQDE